MCISPATQNEILLRAINRHSNLKISRALALLDSWSNRLNNLTIQMEHKMIHEYDYLFDEVYGDSEFLKYKEVNDLSGAMI